MKLTIISSVVDTTSYPQRVQMTAYKPKILYFYFLFLSCKNNALLRSKVASSNKHGKKGCLGPTFKTHNESF